MAIPLHGNVEIPLLLVLAQNGGSATPQQVYDMLSQYFNLSAGDRFHLMTNDEREPVWENHVRQVRRTLVQKGHVSNKVRGQWIITEAGYSRLRQSGHKFAHK